MELTQFHKLRTALQVSARRGAAAELAEAQREEPEPEVEEGAVAPDARHLDPAALGRRECGSIPHPGEGIAEPLEPFLGRGILRVGPANGKRHRQGDGQGGTADRPEPLG